MQTIARVIVIGKTSRPMAGWFQHLPFTFLCVLCGKMSFVSA